MNSKSKKVLIAMSGGVDSSCAAALLIKEGYDCVGAHMKLWKEPNGVYADTEKEAEEVCEKLGIPFHLVDLSEAFKENVVDYFIDKYKTGETPNPCVNCNRTIKFGALLEKAKELGCDYLATGHYVRLEEDENGIMHMFQGEDDKKDQSYFLYVLTQEKLRHILFPLGHLRKTEVRKMASELGLPELEEKAESQDVCFYPEKSNRPFLERQLKEGEDYKVGPIKNKEGEEIGKHKGLPFYTLGQRKGLDIGGGPALYVQEINQKENTLLVGPEDSLHRKEITLKEVNFISGEVPSEEETFKARIRHQGSLHDAKIRQEEELITVVFEDPPNAAMPGQSLVLYRGDELIGGGVMT